MKLYQIYQQLKTDKSMGYVQYNSTHLWVRFTFRKKRFELYSNGGWYVLHSKSYDEIITQWKPSMLSYQSLISAVRNYI